MMESISIPRPSNHMEREPSPVPWLSHVFRDTLQSLLNSGLEGIWVGTDNLSNLLSILEQEERGHSANGELLSDIWNLVDVDLVEFGLRELVGESR